jgi:hypothetical protein
VKIDVTATRLGETGRQPVIERDDFLLRAYNLQSCLADGRLVAHFILAEKSAYRGARGYSVSSTSPARYWRHQKKEMSSKFTHKGNGEGAQKEAPTGSCTQPD